MASDLLITGGTLVDGTGTPARADGAVLISGDSIVAVGAAAEEQAAGRPVDRIDAAGAYVMPGLIDAHCHVTFGEPHSNDELFFHRDQAYASMLAAWNVQKLLRAGVTGFLDADVL